MYDELIFEGQADPFPVFNIELNVFGVLPRLKAVLVRLADCVLSLKTSAKLKLLLLVYFKFFGRNSRLRCVAFFFDQPSPD